MFTTVTRVECQVGKVGAAEEFCRPLLGEIRQQPGCIDVRLYLDTSDADAIVFIASWKDREAWQSHLESPRQRELAAYAASPPGLEMMRGWTSQCLTEVETLASPDGLR